MWLAYSTMAWSIVEDRRIVPHVANQVCSLGIKTQYGYLPRVVGVSQAHSAANYISPLLNGVHVTLLSYGHSPGHHGLL